MTTINFDALQAEDGVKVLLVPATIIETDGTGTSYDDFSAFASVYVTAQAGLREGWRRNDPSLTIIVEHSDDGLSWSTAASFTFGRNDTTGSALVSSPKVHMRARWTVANLSAWQIVSVTAAPTYLDSPSGSGDSSAFARVSLSALIDPWDGSPIPFDTVDVDSESLWDAVNHQFVAKTAGWYEIGAYDSGLDGGVGYPAVSLTNMLLLQVTIIGPGNNLGVTTQQHTGISSGHWWLPPLFGHTHLDPGDFAYIEGIGGGRVTAGFAFSLRLIAAD